MMGDLIQGITAKHIFRFIKNNFKNKQSKNKILIDFIIFPYSGRSVVHAILVFVVTSDFWQYLSTMVKLTK